MDEGDCATAFANEVPHARLLLSSNGSTSFAFESRFTLGLHILEKAWCDLQEGFALSETDAASVVGPFIAYADYMGPLETSDGVTNHDVTAFSCELSEMRTKPGTTKTRVEVQSVSPVCWQTDSYYY